jgi:hypothetical protein
MSCLLPASDLGNPERPREHGVGEGRIAVPGQNRKRARSRGGTPGRDAAARV